MNLLYLLRQEKLNKWQHRLVTLEKGADQEFAFGTIKKEM
jgi:hypothetical protein